MTKGLETGYRVWWWITTIFFIFIGLFVLGAVILVVFLND